MDFASLTPDQILEFGKPCKEFEEISKTHQPPKLDCSDPATIVPIYRKIVEGLTKNDQADTDVDEQIHNAPTRDGANLPLLVFRKKNSTEPSPLIVLFFAGGFVFGSPRTLATLARPLAKLFNAVVVCPTYRLAPEHPFPTGINDGYDALSWIAANATTSLHAEPSKGFIVGGISSGGNISNAIIHLARDNRLKPPVTGVWLCCAGARLATEDETKLPTKYRERLLSRTQDMSANGAGTDLGMAKMTQGCLKPDLNSKLFAPLIWSDDDGFGHHGFPKTYSQICGMDPPRDETLIFDDMLKNAGVPTRVDLYAGLPHIFFHTFKDLPQSEKWMGDTVEGFKWLLEG